MNVNDFPAKSNPKETIREHTDKLISQANILIEQGLIPDEEMCSDLVTACEYHDYGKANSVFKSRIERHSDFNSSEEIPHNVLSMFFIDKEKCINYNAVCFAVAYHHYNVTSPVSVLNQKTDLISKFLTEMFGNTNRLKLSRRIVKNFNSLFSKNFDEYDKKYAVLLKGFLHKCDYSASAGIGSCELPNDFLIDCIDKWKAEKNIEINSLQKFCCDNSDSDIIVTAPTGMGKTEAGLMWCGDNKCFFVLPLKTAINAMYNDRFKPMFGEDYKNRVALIHSDMRSQYMKDFGENDLDGYNEYILKSKQMSLPVTVCTPDQIFDFVLKYPGYEYKLATASYSKFIIDEIQMYSADLLASIIYAIKLIHNVGGKIAVVTATLPPFVREELVKILGKDIPMADFSEYGKLRHNLKTIKDTLKSEYIINEIENIRSDKVKKFLVVCNSIDIANEIYDGIKKFYESNQYDVKVKLFHSAFIKRDRQEKEKAILNADKNSDTEIWVSTSVVEASLDIDFDILFTELSDLFSLFQRMGRVNRKGEKSFQDTNCFVFTELQGNAEKYNFYDKDIHELSKQAILNFEGIIDETTKTALIEEYLSSDNIRSSNYYKDYRIALNGLEKLKEYLKDKNQGLRNIDRVDVIPEPIYNDNKDNIDSDVNIINSRSHSKDEIIKANERLMQFTVSVSKYHADKKRGNEFISFGNRSMPILKNCKYSPETGIEILKYKQTDEHISNFI